MEKKSNDYQTNLTLFFFLKKLKQRCVLQNSDIQNQLPWYYKVFLKDFTTDNYLLKQRWIEPKKTDELQYYSWTRQPDNLPFTSGCFGTLMLFRKKEYISNIDYLSKGENYKDLSGLLLSETYSEDYYKLIVNTILSNLDNKNGKAFSTETELSPIECIKLIKLIIKAVEDNISEETLDPNTRNIIIRGVSYNTVTDQLSFNVIPSNICGFFCEFPEPNEYLPPAIRKQNSNLKKAKVKYFIQNDGYNNKYMYLLEMLNVFNRSLDKDPEDQIKAFYELLNKEDYWMMLIPRKFKFDTMSKKSKEYKSNIIHIFISQDILLVNKNTHLSDGNIWNHLEIDPFLYRFLHLINDPEINKRSLNTMRKLLQYYKAKNLISKAEEEQYQKRILHFQEAFNEPDLTSKDKAGFVNQEEEKKEDKKEDKEEEKEKKKKKKKVISESDSN